MLTLKAEKILVSANMLIRVFCCEACTHCPCCKYLSDSVVKEHAGVKYIVFTVNNFLC